MFLCKNCHTKHYGTSGGLHPSSRGPCESCGHTDLCGDCHCPQNQSVLSPEALKRDLIQLREELA
jgi:hypothetical protein